METVPELVFSSKRGKGGATSSILLPNLVQIRTDQ